VRLAVIIWLVTSLNFAIVVSVVLTTLYSSISEDTSEIVLIDEIGPIVRIYSHGLSVNDTDLDFVNWLNASVKRYRQFVLVG
jgi:hypothetical protein